MADEYPSRPGVPQRTAVLLDIRSNAGGATSGYTGRAGVPQDVDVLMDIRDALSGGGAGGRSALAWRGTVATAADLPSGASVGDTYHVNADGSERTWDGSAWQELGSAVDLSGKQDRLTAGSGIELDGSTISVKPGRTWGEA